MSDRIRSGMAAAFAVLMLQGCDYGHKQYRHSDHNDALSSPLLIVEVDDFGRFWDRAAAEDTLEAISNRTLNRNTVVVIFIHGWHHNAADGDTNLSDFRNAVSQLEDKLRQAPYQHAREQLKLTKDIHVIGLYVGWRGKSLPGLLDYLTFWGRKSAAERAGEGDFREFLLKLQRIYMARNSGRPSETSTFMGLVTIGHSFGGQVLFKAVAETLENDLINAVASPTHRPGKVLPEIISGIGDMTVLLNPALEAFQYERIDRLTSQTIFKENQAPVLLTVSSENDWARQFWFPVGRNANWPFRANFPSKQARQLWLNALGEYEPHRTHVLDPTKDAATVNDEVYKNCEILTRSLTDSLVVGGARLRPERDPPHRFNPVLVAYTNRELVNGHNGIFGERFRNFLTDYVSLVEGKRMCLIRTRPEPG